MAGMVNFDEVNAVALANLEGLVRDWLPAGKRNGNEWQCGDWDGKPGVSIGFNTYIISDSDDKAVWYLGFQRMGKQIGLCF